ncbi:MAG: cytochrome c biogenesis protein CcsA [Arcobacteraceae bacterium]|nr:cytochrome c biogenesis protein CcsA [Arcobacteraceae bacterium]
MFQKLFFSYWMTIFLLSLLAIGAGVATFIENDFGSSTARIFVYNNFWYELVLTLTIFNLIGIMAKVKMMKSKAKFIFHSSFVVMLIGAALTRYYGYEGIMNIREGETTNQMISLEPYVHITTYKEGKSETSYFEKDFAAFGNSGFAYKVPVNGTNIEVNYVDYQLAKKGMSKMGLLTVEAKYKGETQQTRLVGQRGMRTGVVKDIVFKDGTKVSLEYGSKPLELPFAIKLNDFELERYPGSMAPSSYSSKVELIDKAANVQFPFHIYMNHILYYDGFKFFQSSYDPDEMGTVLSVNKDIGHWPTYLGYFMLLVGLVMNFFDKDSRFAKLTRYIAKANQTAVFFVVALFLFGTTSLKAEIQAPVNLNDTVSYLEKYKEDSKAVAEQFSHLIVQADMGRMKPMDTLSREILNKLSRQSEFLGMNPNQVVLGMLTNPNVWKDIKIIKVDTPKMREFLGVPNDRKYVAFSEILTQDGYKLAQLLEDVNKIDPNQRGTFEKDALRVDERVNIMYMIFLSDMFKIYPKIGDINNQWISPNTAINTLEGKDKEVIYFITSNFIAGVSDGNYTNASKSLELISMYQQKFGKDIYPSSAKIDAELMFNKLDIFPRLTLAYLLVGIVMFIIAFATVFKQSLSSNKVNNILFGLLAILFIIQTVGMGFRWYISGHAPWSNTYESLVYIAWSIMFAGVVFFRQSLMALSATVVMAAVFMFTAHLSGIDPQITNLVPVLKSYWLTIHVSIITGSYGFLALGAMLGFMALILFNFRNENKPHIDKTIKHITAINEAALIIGLSALVVGNFLGGVWANESWGRYWGWDPKETWAYVAIVVYVIVLHLRLIPKLNRPYVLAVASALAFSTILMTYFGVNFYLSGMHSYATGDPVPIPMWVYYVTATVFAVIALAYRKRDLSVIKL